MKTFSALPSLCVSEGNPPVTGGRGALMFSLRWERPVIPYESNFFTICRKLEAKFISYLNASGITTKDGNSYYIYFRVRPPVHKCLELLNTKNDKTVRSRKTHIWSAPRAQPVFFKICVMYVSVPARSVLWLPLCLKSSSQLSVLYIYIYIYIYGRFQNFRVSLRNDSAVMIAQLVWVNKYKEMPFGMSKTNIGCI